MQNLIVQFGDASVLADFINIILNLVQLIVFSTAFPLVLLNLLGQFSLFFVVNYILLCTKSFAYSTHITELCCFRCICKTSLSCRLMKLKRLLIKVIIAGAKRHIFNNLTFSANYGIILM